MSDKGVTNRQPGVPSVETIRCPALDGGTHQLIADRAARVTCAHCAETWGALDQRVREAL